MSEVSYKIRKVDQPLVLADLIYLIDENPEKFTHCDKRILQDMIVKMFYQNTEFLMYVIYTDTEDLVGYLVAQADLLFNHELFIYDAYVTEKYRKTRALKYAVDEVISISLGAGLDRIAWRSRMLPKEHWEEFYTFGGKIKTYEVMYLEMTDDFSKTYDTKRREVL